MVWAVAERGSTRNGKKEGWLVDRSGNEHRLLHDMRHISYILCGMEFSGCCAEMVAHCEGKKCHNPSGDNQKMSFRASDHRFGYGRTENWPSTHIPI